MRGGRSALVTCFAVCVGAAGALVRAGQQGQGQSPSPLPLSNPVRERGSSVTGAYEGWYRDNDGFVRVLVGYFNRNTKQELDIPIGPNNRIEPGGPDQGQPTHFQTGRQWGVFAFKAPSNFANQTLTWTLVVNGQTNTITMHMRPEWVVEPFEDVASKNTPPVIKLRPDGPAFAGPPSGLAATYTATVSTPLGLTAWATDEPAKLNVANAQLTTPGPLPAARGTEPAARGTAPSGGGAGAGRGRGVGGPPPVALSWSLFRGPAPVAFDPARPAVSAGEGGKATTTATFSAPGEYLLRLQANDSSGDGGGGFQCCWTNVHVSVSVKPAAGGK